jgi:hypothetical protein
MKNFYTAKFGTTVVLITLLVVSCGAPVAEATPTSAPSPTSTPVPATDTPAPTETPTPEPVLGTTPYSSDEMGISLEYPTGWFVSQSDNYLILGTREDYVNGPTPDSIDEGECWVTLFVTSTDIQQQYGDPITALDGYTLFAGIEMPNKEPAHMVTLNNKEYAMGTYSEAGGDVPLFTSMRFTDVNTIVTELYASPNDEEKFRPMFEKLLSSIEIDSTMASATQSPIDETLGRFLVAKEDLTGWNEPAKSREIYDDGICQILAHETIQDYVLVNCIIYKSASYDLNTLREYYASNTQNVFIDLEDKTKHTYDYDFDLYAYLDSGGFPKYTLLLETDIIVYSVALITPHFGVGIKFEEGIPERFDDEMDDLLHNVVAINLEKSK